MPSEAELREQAAWKQVEETGKPVQFENKLLIPDGMSIWEAVDSLPDGIREQTRSAMQQKVAKAYLGVVKYKHAEIIEKIAEHGKWEKYRTFPYAVQLAIADSLLRQELGLPEISMKELIVTYGGEVEDTPDDDS
jgi:hypothetical protein